MDKVKNALAILKKHHFWVLCGVVVVASLACWWITTGGLAAEAEARTGQIQGSFSAMSNIINQSAHPNGKVITDIVQKTERESAEVIKAWRFLYEEQKERNQLPEILTAGFKNAFNHPDPDYDIGWRYREEYMNFIDEQIPKLFEIGDILRPADGLPPIGGEVASGLPVGLGGMGRELDDEEDMLGIVEWEQTDQDRVRTAFDWQAVPSTLRVRLAQEDLWVYEALMRIIKNTNGPVKVRQDAAIKQILALQIGRDAATAWQSAAGDFMAAGSATDPMAVAATPGNGQRSPNEGVVSDDLLTDRRYVDADAQPLAADQPPPYAEFKLMPIYLNLVMNQTKLTKLLVECANSSMPIEVRKITVGGDSIGTFNDPNGSRGYETRIQGTATQTDDAMDVQVEIQGTICIYNPPDEAKLGTGSAAEGATDEAAPPVEPAPAAATGPTDSALAGGTR